jgi:hypothetical protein
VNLPNTDTNDLGGDEESMLYFRFLALLFGTTMVFLAPVIALRGQRWIDLFSEALIPEKQPVWFWAAGAFAAFLTLITWYMQITSPVTLSWVMTLFITLSLVKAYCFIFRYDQTRKVALSLMDKGRTFTTGLAGILFLAGFCILCLGIFAF